MKNLIKIYNKIILSKSSIITFFVSVGVIFFIILYMLISQQTNYILYQKNVEKNYVTTLGTISSISIIFIISFLSERESNLTIDSFDTMTETQKGRTYVFITKQILYISFCLILSLVFFLISFIPSYFIFDMFKFNFFISYISFFLYSIEILEIASLFNYLTKNFFITLMISILLVIKEFISVKNIGYFIPGIIFDNGIEFDVDICYACAYLIILIIINFLLYRFKDRK